MTRRKLEELLRERSAFLFDLDGTLVDSGLCHEQAFVVALRTYRADLLDQFDYEKYQGQSTRAVFSHLGVKGSAEARLLAAAKQDFYYEEVRRGGIRAIVGAPELLADLALLGKQVYVVTGGSSRSTAAVLEVTGLAQYVSGLVTGEDVSRCKPAPDGFLACLSSFGLAPGRSVVVEDAVAGVEAARTAGLECVAVNNPKLSDSPEFAGELKELAKVASSLRGAHV